MSGGTGYKGRNSIKRCAENCGLCGICKPCIGGTPGESGYSELEERLKYYHIRCIHCDEKLFEFLKLGSLGFVKEIVCPICDKKVKILFKQSLSTNLINYSEKDVTYILLENVFNGKN